MNWSKSLCALVLCLALALCPVDAQVATRKRVRSTTGIDSADVADNDVKMLRSLGSPSAEAVLNKNSTSDEATRQQQCPPGELYSSKYDLCFSFSGPCWQYDFLDKDTCQNGADGVICEWFPDKKHCNPICQSYEWLSTTYGLCFPKNGSCFQYDNTDRYTCTTRYGYSHCEWDVYNEYCNPVCEPDEWLSTDYGICFKKKGECQQYDETDATTCETGNDNIQCDWNASNLQCNPE